MKRNKYRAEEEAKILRKRIFEAEAEQSHIMAPTKSMLEYLLTTHDINRFSTEGIYNLQRFGLIDDNGNISDKTVIDMLEMRD